MSGISVMKRLVTLFTAFWMTTTASAIAEQAVVVELFTSQGCSSCPPADKILGEIAKRDNVIALALHVDYWDYIGWKDQFAQPKFTDRQRDYARAARERTIYTPQMVIGGKDHVIGSRPNRIAELLKEHGAKTPAVAVQVKRNGTKITIEAAALKSLSRSAAVQLVTYRPNATVDIGRGENAGRRITYHNIVQDWIEIGDWNGNGTFTASAEVPANMPFVVLVQSGTDGVMLGAAHLR